MNIDFHCHVLPGVDDGSRNIKESIEMLKLAQKSGTTKIITTPHYYAMRGFETEYGEIKKLYSQLKETAIQEELTIEIKCGQEIGYGKDILMNYESGNLGTINNSNYMLIEFPLFDFSPREILDTIYELQIKGIKPIIAHPERYPLFLNKPELINLFIKEGYLFQLNSDSLVGQYGKSIKKLAELYVKHGIYSVFGSDAHSIKYRTTDMTEGIKRLFEIDNDYESIMDRNASFILNNMNVSFEGEVIRKKKSIFKFFYEIV